MSTATTTTTTTTDANIAALLEALTYENWFTQLAVLSDAYREIGDNAKADRCDDLRLAGKRPKIEIIGDQSELRSELRIKYQWGWYLDILDGYYLDESSLHLLTVKAIDRFNLGYISTEKIQSQLLAYLEVPEHLRISKKGN